MGKDEDEDKDEREPLVCEACGQDESFRPVMFTLDAWFAVAGRDWKPRFGGAGPPRLPFGKRAPAIARVAA